jgi:hypothetical protein
VLTCIGDIEEREVLVLNLYCKLVPDVEKAKKVVMEVM